MLSSMSSRSMQYLWHRNTDQGHNRSNCPRITALVRAVRPVTWSCTNSLLSSLQKAARISMHRFIAFSLVNVVETRGVEPRTSCMPCKRSSQLSYVPLVGATGIEPVVFCVSSR